jgi:hypothetical protein
MKAIAFTRPLPIEAEDSLVELDLPRHEPRRFRSIRLIPRCAGRGTRERRRWVRGSRACLGGMRQVLSWARARP